MAKIDLSVIDQFFSAQLSANESEATLKALRPQVEIAVQALIEERGLPKNFTGAPRLRVHQARLHHRDHSVSRSLEACFEKESR